MKSPMIVVQCWDDAVTTDIRLTDLLRKYEAKATFNLNAGLYETTPKFGWMFKETEVFRLGWPDMKEIYQGFTIANHSLTHPRLDQIPVEQARKDIVEGRTRLQQFFQAPIPGFAYPFGTYNEAVMDAVREAGHVYARTTKNVEQPVPPGNAMAFHPSCHFLASDFWSRYEKAKKGGVFYFWGHSYEMISDTMWADFEDKIERITSDPEVQWGNIAELPALNNGATVNRM